MRNNLIIILFSQRQEFDVIEYCWKEFFNFNFKAKLAYAFNLTFFHYRMEYRISHFVLDFKNSFRLVYLSLSVKKLQYVVQFAWGFIKNWNACMHIAFHSCFNFIYSAKASQDNWMNKSGLKYDCNIYRTLKLNVRKLYASSFVLNKKLKRVSVHQNSHSKI